MIKSIYIVSLAGVPLYIYDLTNQRKTKEDNTEQVTLFSGVLSAIQSLLSDFNVGEAKYFATESNEIFMEIANNFGLVLIKDLNDCYSEAVIKMIMSEIITALTFAFQDLNESTIQSYEHKQKVQKIIENILRKYESSTDATMLSFGVVCEEYKERMIKNRDGSVSFLLDMVKSNLDMLFYGLLTRNTIVICGEEDIIRKIIKSIELISPFQLLRIVPYTTEFIEPKNADVIGISRDLESKYKRSKAVVLCIEKQTTYGNKNNSYLKPLIKDLRKLNDESKIRAKLIQEICRIFSYCNELMELFSSKDFDKKDFENFKKQMPDNLFNLVIDICKSKNEEIEMLIKKLEFFGVVF